MVKIFKILQIVHITTSVNIAWDLTSDNLLIKNFNFIYVYVYKVGWYNSFYCINCILLIVYKFWSANLFWNFYFFGIKNWNLIKNKKLNYLCKKFNKWRIEGIEENNKRIKRL